MARIGSWDMLVSKFKKKLTGWKVKMISIGGRFTLNRSVLGTLGIYYCSLFKMLVKIGNLLESLSASFLWGANT